MASSQPVQAPLTEPLAGMRKLQQRLSAEPLIMTEGVYLTANALMLPPLGMPSACLGPAYRACDDCSRDFWQSCNSQSSRHISRMKQKNPYCIACHTIAWWGCSRERGDHPHSQARGHQRAFAILEQVQWGFIRVLRLTSS